MLSERTLATFYLEMTTCFGILGVLKNLESVKNLKIMTDLNSVPEDIFQSIISPKPIYTQQRWHISKKLGILQSSFISFFLYPQN